MSNSRKIILSMLEDVKNHKRDKSTLFPYYVEKRLNKSVATYYKELTYSRDVLSYLSNKRVIKKLVKQ